MRKKTKKFAEDKNNNTAIFKKKKLIMDEISQIKDVEGMYNFIKKLPNPDVVLQKTGKGIHVLRQLESDGQVATCIQSRQAGVLSLKRHLKYNENNEKHKEFYEKLLKRLQVNNIIKDILNAPKYGYQPIEIIWEVDEDGFTVPKDISARPPEWFYFNAQDRQLRFNKKGMPDGLLITEDMKKFLCPRTNADYLNPYGQGYLSKCFWDTIFKKGSFEFWIKFAERYGIPWLVGKYSRGASDDEIDKMLEALEAMLQDAVAAFPDDAEIEIHETQGKSASVDVFNGIIETCDKNIAKNILGQTLTTDVGSSGSYSLGQVHQQVREDIIHTDKELAESQFNILLRWIHELNFGDNDAPEFELYKEDEIDQARAERDTKIHGMGVKFTKEYFIKAYGYDDNDIIIENNDSSNFSETDSKDDELEKLIDGFSDSQLDEILSEKISPIIKNFAEVQDPEKALENLAVLYPDKDSSSLEDTLKQAIFISNLWGRVNDKE